MITSENANTKGILTVFGFLVILVVISLPVGSETLPTGVLAVVDTQNPLLLHITVQSFAESRITLFKSQLPWGNRHSMTIVAVTPDGRCIDHVVAIDDPSPEEVSLDPKASLSGDLNLEKVVPGLSSALKKSDIHLFWAYEAPEKLRVARWSGGWILIPQKK